MNYRRIPACIVALLFLIIEAKTQSFMSVASTMPFMQQLPEKTVCRPGLLKKLFSASHTVSIPLTASCLLRGSIISRTKQNPSSETINIRLLDFPKIVFTLSCIRLDDGSTRYNGHMLSLQGSDALVLQKEKEKYYFIKSRQSLLITE